MNFLKDSMLILFASQTALWIVATSHWDYFSTKGVTEPKYMFALAIISYIVWCYLDYRETFSLLPKYGNTTN